MRAAGLIELSVLGVAIVVINLLKVINLSSQFK